jgi:hypothetical protein
MKRKIYKLLSTAKQMMFALALTVFSGTANAQTTFTFNYTGSTQTINLPTGTYEIEMWGADGGTNSSNSGTTPGKGGYSKGNIMVNAATTYSIYVGGKGNSGAQPLGGFNSGNGTTKTNLATSTGGGGASDVRVLVDDYFHRIIVAGGGGGQGNTSGTGGHGGGLTGQNGQGSVTNIGIGGTQTSAGVYPGGSDSKPAAFGEGSDGPAGTTGGQGGGGWYGGSFGTRTNGGGAGGSGYVLTSSSFIPTGYFSAHANYYFTNAVTLRADETGFVANPDVSGDGLVIIRQLCNISLTANGPFVNNAICAGNSVTLSTNAISNYSWSTGATSSVLVVSPGVTTSYSLTATSPSNCSTSAVITITVNGAIPSLTVINTASTSAGICPNSTVNLLASGALTYTWTGGTQTVTNGVTFSPTLAATYTVTGGNGCGTQTAATSVSVHPLPVVTPVASSGSLCSGSSLTLTAQGNASTYTWTGGSVSFTNGIGFVPATSTIYSLTGTSVLNCTAMATIPVTVYVTPTLVPTAAPAIVCLGGSSTLSAAGALSYTWISASQTVNTSTMMVTPTSTGITTYTVIKANSNCSDTKTINVITNDLPTVAAIVMPATVCALSPATLAAGGALTYTWTAPGTPNFTFTGASNVISTPVPATYTVAASDGTCINTSTVHLATNPNPTISASASATNICEGNSVNLSASGASNYTWTTGTGTLYTASITDSPTGPTAYQVIGDNAFGCTAQANLIVLVSQSPTLIAGPDKNLICNNSPVTFTASGASTYTWDANAGNATGASVVLNPTNTISGPVIYTVSGTNTVGCVGTTTTLVQIYIPTLSVSGNTNACKNGTLELTASGANSGSYSWNTGSGSPIPGASLNTSLSAPAIFTISASTTSLSITCPVSQTIQADLYPEPSITASSERTTICQRESVELYAGGGNTYLWNNGASGATISVSPLIQTNYTVTGTDANGCTNTATVQIRVVICPGINELLNSISDLMVYPNPNNGEFTIRSEGTDLKLILVNELGQLIQHLELSAGNNHQVSVKDLAKGIYFLSGSTETGAFNQKIVVTK